MQFIRQDYKIDSRNINKLLSRYGKVQVGLNPQAITDDIERLKIKADNSKNKIYVKNCWRLVDYLKKLNRVATQNDTINLEFKYNGKFIVSDPIEVRKLDGFNVQTTDYFDLMGKYVMTLDYSNLINGLALELGYYDLGYSTDEIEEKLADIGIVATYDSKDLGDLLEDSLYRTLYGLRIEDSSYLAPDGKSVYDYYGEKVTDRISYIGMLDSTARKTMAIITADVLTEALNNKYNVELAGVYEDSLVLLIPSECNTEEVSSKLGQPEVARLFGRKFLFEPAITIY